MRSMPPHSNSDRLNGKNAHKNAIERLKDSSKRIRNRVLARKSMDPQTAMKDEVREKNRMRARARAQRCT